MSLTSEYQRQFAWRDWATALDACPLVPGQRVLDLGCGVGDVSRQLALRGAVVTGIDSNVELLAAAETKQHAGVTFLNQDLRRIDLQLKSFDGIWASFVTAYFPNIDEVLEKWHALLNDRGWICLVEIDDLLGHAPFPADFRSIVERFYEEARAAKRYDFLMGRRLESALKKQGFVVRSFDLADPELSFSGPANSDVIQAWSDRLDRMGGLKNFLGGQAADFRQAFLSALSAQNHRSFCRVICSVGHRA